MISGRFGFAEYARSRRQFRFVGPYPPDMPDAAGEELLGIVECFRLYVLAQVPA